MRLVWSTAALRDLKSTISFLAGRNPTAAKRFLLLLSGGAESLTTLPNRGAPGLEPGTRELRVHRPYIIVYETEQDVVRILRIWHAAQDRG